MEFSARQLSSRPDTVLVRYDCECGCKPGAEYKQGAEEAGHEHCCCGNVHFAGPGAREQLEAYLADRKGQGMDDERGGYTLHETQVPSPWGDIIPIAYGLPNNRGH